MDDRKYLVRLRHGVLSWRTPGGEVWAPKQERPCMESEVKRLAYYRRRSNTFEVRTAREVAAAGPAAPVAPSRRGKTTNYSKDKAEALYGAATGAPKAARDPSEPPPVVREKATEPAGALAFAHSVKKLIGLPAEINGDEMSASLVIDNGDDTVTFDISKGTIGDMTPADYANDIMTELTDRASEEGPGGRVPDPDEEDDDFDDAANASEDAAPASSDEVQPKEPSEDAAVAISLSDVEALTINDKDQLWAIARIFGMRPAPRSDFNAVKRKIIEKLSAPTN